MFGTLPNLVVKKKKIPIWRQGGISDELSRRVYTLRRPNLAIALQSNAQKWWEIFQPFLLRLYFPFYRIHVLGNRIARQRSPKSTSL